MRKAVEGGKWYAYFAEYSGISQVGIASYNKDMPRFLSEPSALRPKGQGLFPRHTRAEIPFALGCMVNSDHIRGKDCFV